MNENFPVIPPEDFEYTTLHEVLSKKILQPYAFTTARQPYNLTQKRIFYRIIELLQVTMGGLRIDQLPDNWRISQDLWGETQFTIPVQHCYPQGEEPNYSSIRKHFLELTKRRLVWDEPVKGKKPITRSFALFTTAAYDPNRRVFEFTLQKDCLTAFALILKRYTKIDLAVAFQLKSVWAMRFYEFIVSIDHPITITLDELRNRFALGPGYDRNIELFRKIIDVAQKELRLKSPDHFNYAKRKKPGTNKFEAITIFPKQNIKINPNPAKELKRLSQELSPRNYFDREFLDYCYDVIGFEPKGLKNNIGTFRKAQKTLDIDKDWLVKTRTKALKNGCKQDGLPGYLITTMKLQMKELNLTDEQKARKNRQTQIDF